MTTIRKLLWVYMRKLAGERSQTDMFLELDLKSSIPVYIQLRNEIVRGIGSGELAFGEQLPTVRSLAADLSVNSMTVSKAYQLLDSQGYIHTDRRRGTVVCARGEMPDFLENPDSKRELVLLAREAALGGYTREEFLKLCSDAYIELV